MCCVSYVGSALAVFSSVHLSHSIVNVVIFLVGQKGYVLSMAFSIVIRTITVVFRNQ